MAPEVRVLDPDHPPIPCVIWTRIREYLAGGKTGSITLHVTQGRVVDCALEERVRAGRE